MGAPLSVDGQTSETRRVGGTSPARRRVAARAVFRFEGGASLVVGVRTTSRESPVRRESAKVAEAPSVTARRVAGGSESVASARAALSGPETMRVCATPLAW